MSRRDVGVTLQQMAQFALRATELGREGSRSTLDADWRFQSAAERTVELIGEAATRLPVDLRNRYPEIPWREMISMRNRLIHGYDGVDCEILWDVLITHAPALVEKLPSIIAKESINDAPESH